MEKTSKLIDQAMKENPDLIVLPEMFNTEYFPQYRDRKYVTYAEPETGETISTIKQKAKECKVNIIATIYEEKMTQAIRLLTLAMICL